ncbi:NAD-dependent epimerase/dehydratase family protein [Paenibacillus hamazuiensis]|uniref:NAD-dependent epimerase/dehydratase family protein n=1 Tax=Paenibacillus hamazuiensis TaxID=2936508 RepID=UPI00200CFDB8|nr:NAD(P)-dependent oxidoreductase [Paenibacillus hamazuiensis]
MKNVLVTGGSGRLGRYVIEYLLERNYRVTGFDCAAPDAADYPAGVPFVKGDLTDPGDCMRAVSLSEAEAIVHLAAIPYDTDLHPGQSRIQRLPEDETMKVNTMGTYYLMDAARRFKHVKTVVMASSYYTLGLGRRISGTPFQVDYLPIDEDHPNRPEDTYALSKMIGEEILKTYSRAYGIRTVAFRLQGIDWPSRKSDYKYGDALEPRTVPKGGPVVTTYQYLDPRDAAQAFQLAIEAEHLEPFEAFYLLTDSRHSEETKHFAAKVWPELKEMAAHLEGTEGIITCKKLREKLGYEPKYSWRNQPETVKEAQTTP